MPVCMSILFFASRLSYAISIVYMGSVPRLQAVSQVLSSFYILVFIVKCKLFKKKEDFFFECINEGTWLSCSYFLLLFCGVLDSEMRYKIGWYIVAITLVNLLVNYINLIINVRIEIYRKIKEKCEQKSQ